MKFELTAVSVVAGLVAGVGCLADPGVAVGRDAPARTPAEDTANAETEPPCLARALEPPTLMSLKGYAYHWTSSQRCLPVSHDPSLRASAPRISDALNAWNAVSCSQLKFCPLLEIARPFEELVAPTDADRYVHFTAQSNPDFFDDAVTLTIKRESGRVLNAVGIVTTPDTYTPHNWVKTAGTALGIDAAQSAGPPETVMVPGWVGDDGATRPGPLDERTLCTVYGQPPMCAEPSVE